MSKKTAKAMRTTKCPACGKEIDLAATYSSQQFARALRAKRSTPLNSAKARNMALARWHKGK
jgi:endogenous inhibitor of DNA gyrase (YacG/DUF329 family)